MSASIRIRILFILLLAPLLWGCDNSDSSDNGPGVQVSFQLLNVDGLPIAPLWLAFQDGDGPWEHITAADDDQVYRRMVTDVAADETWTIGLGPRIAYPMEENPTDYDMGVPVPGIYDVLAARLDAAGVPERLWVRRQMSFTGNTVLNVAFDDPEYATAGETTSVPVINGALQRGQVNLQAKGCKGV